MGPRKNLVKVLAACMLAAAALVVLAPKLVFPVCESPMHCHYSYMAEIGLAAVVAVAALAAIFAKGAGTPRSLALVTSVAGVFMVLYPSELIGVCGSTRMPCHYGLLPVWNLAGGAVVLLSAIIFFASREGES